MKTLARTAIAVIAFVSVCQAQEQSGVPAKMHIVGVEKELRVFLQRVENGKLYFQRYRQAKDLAGPLSRIASLEFMGNFDAAAARELYRVGDFELMISQMNAELPLDEYWPYMRIKNNYQDVFCMLTRAYLELGDYENATKAAAILMESTSDSVLSTAQSVSIMIALKEGKIDEAEGLLENIDSPAGVLYFKACIERAKNEPKAAIKLATELIDNFGNDLDWMPKAELLCAYLYQDMAASKPDPYLDSAKQTARQVKHIYAGTNIAALAERLEGSIAELQERLEAEAKAKAEAEEKAKAEVRARAEKRAQSVFGTEQNESDGTGDGADTQTGEGESDGGEGEQNGTGQ